MKNPFSFLSEDIGIDLGTSNSLIYVAGKGIVLHEPSVAAINQKTGKILAVGREAKKMIGRTPHHIAVVRPLVNGVISDFEMAEEMLREFLKRIEKQPFATYRRAIIGVPANLTEVERKSVEDAVRGAGASQAFLIEESLAAALGARLPISEPVASMVVDIGGGTSEIAAISMGGVVTSQSIKIAGDKFNEDIMRFVRDEFQLAIGEPTAEEIKISIGSAAPLAEKLEMEVRGRSLQTGLPKAIIMRDAQVRTALNRSLRALVDAIREVIEKAPPELAGDMLQRGILLCGGGSILRGLDELIARELSVATMVADDPLTCVARGTGVAIENFKQYEPILSRPLIPRDIK